jgi:metal-sulfur cluster biosynthetic enzyme
MNELTAEAVRAALAPITDPEIAISIVELGLIRAVEVAPDGATVKVTMTLTTPFCPEGPAIVAAVDEAVRALPGVKDATVELQWNPPWDPRKEASEEVKAQLGIWD